MKNLSIIFLTLLVATAVILPVIIVIVLQNKRRKLPDGTILVKPESFYNDHRDATLKYLNSVYPQGKESFEAMNSADLAIFYNSLWYYYNCEASFDQTFGETSSLDPKQVKHCWQPLPGCGKEWPKLPYTPQGYLYSFQDWINNMWTPWIYSKSERDPSYFTGSFPGITLWAWFNGPSELFTPQRVIMRMVYSPKSPEFHVWEDAYKEGEFHAYNQPVLTPGSIGQYSSYWNYPRNWWLGEIPYMEVTWSNVIENGATVSALVWWNGAPGSGIFLKLGKSIKARNKPAALFQLAQELASTQKGRDEMMTMFQSSNPYDVVAGFLIYPWRWVMTTVWDPVNMKKVQMRPDFKSTALAGIPTRADGWNNIMAFNTDDWYRWCQKNAKPDSNRKWAFDIPDECIDDIIEGKTYMADRIAAQGIFDDAMNWLGWRLGYDNLILTQSSNGNGFWQVEIVELRGFPQEVVNRDYSTFVEKTGDNEMSWRFDNGWIENYINSLNQYLSLRDPIDVLNDKKAQKCLFSIPFESLQKLGRTWNAVCSNNISNMYANLSINGATDNPPIWNQCSPDGVGFDRQPMKTPNSPPFG
jgi:hypothetical protein